MSEPIRIGVLALVCSVFVACGGGSPGTTVAVSGAGTSAGSSGVTTGGGPPSRPPSAQLQVSPPVVTPPMLPMTLPPVDKTKLMKPAVGYATDNYTSALAVGVPSGDGAFRVKCDASHMNFDDALLYPGVPNASHLHQYFVNTHADNSTAANATPGNSTCSSVGRHNLSQAWVPAIVQDGRPIPAVNNNIYYKTGEIADASSIRDIPEGLRFIWGGSMASYSPQPKYISHYTWGCSDPVTGQGDEDPAAGPGQPGYHGEWPWIPPCAVGKNVMLQIIAPSCWNGIDLDSPDHRSHMSYPDTGTRICDAAHPVALPTITYNVAWPVKAGDDPLKWWLSSDAYFGNNPKGYPGGLTAHADYIGGWVAAHFTDFNNRCVRVRIDCH